MKRLDVRGRPGSLSVQVLVAGKWFLATGQHASLLLSLGPGRELRVTFSEAQQGNRLVRRVLEAEPA
jgi:hypothetical protein